MTEPFGQFRIGGEPMPGFRELSEPTHSEKTEGDWVDFPASPDPDPWGTLLREANHLAPDVSRGGYWDAKRVGGVVMASLGVVLRGLLVTTAALAIVAYLLLTNSHI
jgi:hypothetical protein